MCDIRETPDGPAKSLLETSPVKTRPGIAFASGGNVFVTCDMFDGISNDQCMAQVGQRRVLGRLEPVAFQPFELDADRVVIAVVATAPTGRAGVPGALVSIDKLNQFTVTPDEEVSRYFGTSNLFKVGVGLPVKLIGEQLFDFRATILAWWQTD